MSQEMDMAIVSNEISSKSAIADWAGMAASIGCAIHCAAMPLVIGYLPVLGLDWLANESFHKFMAVVCFGLAATAFVPGWRKHGSLLPLSVGAGGIALLTLAAFGLEGHCCPTCTTPTKTQTALTEAQVAEPACQDAECQSCETVGPPNSTTTNSSSILTWATPLITPLGGLFLVAGHLVNHRKSCRCQGDQCCL